MLGCSFRHVWVCVNWLTITWTWAMRRGRANPGDKMLTLGVGAGGRRPLTRRRVLRTGGTAQTLGCVVKAPSTLGTFLRSFRWGQLRLLARAWSAGAGPGDAAFADLRDIRSGQGGGARPRLHWGKRGFHPLLAVAAGTGDVLMARCARGQHRLPPTPEGDGGAGALRRWPGDNSRCVADSGFYTHAIVAACRRMGCPFSITIRQSASLRSLIEAIPAGLDAHPLLDGRRRPTWETSYTPFQSKPDAAPVRLRPAREAHARFPVGPLRHLQLSRLHHRPGGGKNWRPTIGATPIENAIRDLKYGVGLNHLPSGRFPANGAWLAVQVIAHNLARWTMRASVWASRS